MLKVDTTEGVTWARILLMARTQEFHAAMLMAMVRLRQSRSILASTMDLAEFQMQEMPPPPRAKS